jgi:bacteriorhodopsin
MTIVSAIFAILSWNVAVQRRIFYFLTTLTTIISALAYFAMASGQASTYNCVSVRDHHKHVPDTHHDVCRQVFWARYVDWAITTPILVLELGLLAGIDGAHTIFGIVANVIFVLASLFSAIGIHGHLVLLFCCLFCYHVNILFILLFCYPVKTLTLSCYSVITE